MRDVLSPYCQRLKNVTVERLDRYDAEEDAWTEAVVEDTRTATVFEIVSFRCDFKDWLKTLKPRDRQGAKFLALGHRTSDAAQKFAPEKGEKQYPLLSDRRNIVVIADEAHRFDRFGRHRAGIDDDGLGVRSRRPHPVGAIHDFAGEPGVDSALRRRLSGCFGGASVGVAASAGMRT